MEQIQTFYEVINRLFDETKEIEVVATNWINDEGFIDVALRSGSAYFDIPFHDPIIYNYVFMIYGDFKAYNEYCEYGDYDLDELEEDEVENGYFVKLRAETMVGNNLFTIDLGQYSIKKAEKIIGRAKDYLWNKGYKLAIKRKD